MEEGWDGGERLCAQEALAPEPRRMPGPAYTKVPVRCTVLRTKLFIMHCTEAAMCAPVGPACCTTPAPSPQPPDNPTACPLATHPGHPPSSPTLLTRT